MKALFFSELSESTLRVRLVPEDREMLLVRIQENVRALEQFIPFPCTKSDTTLRYIQSGADRGKFEVSFIITCEKLITMESAIFHLHMAGFKRAAR